MQKLLSNNLSHTERKKTKQKLQVINSIIKVIKRDYELCLLALPAVLYLFIFNYLPMYGIQIAFKDFVASKGIWGSPWVQFKHFNRFFSSFQFSNIIRNTFLLGLYSIIFAFPVPIIFSLLLNQIKNKKIKNSIQTITYAPHFISTVVMSGMLFIFLSPYNGIINQLLSLFGIEPIYFMGDPKWFRTVYILSGIWQHTGWEAVLYIGALSSIDPQLYEAAKIDGAKKLQIIRHVDIPGITPTIIILLILNLGTVMSIGFDKVFLMQNELNLSVSEVISTYTYKVGLVNAQYSYSTAIGLFNTLVNFVLLLIVNKAAKIISETSLW